MMDPNFDIVPTLRMFDGLMMNKAADEIERLRLEVARLSANVAQGAHIAMLEAQLIDARARLDRAIAILTRIHSFMTPEDVRLPDGRVMQFSNSEVERKMLRGLCKAIRAVPDEIANVAQGAVAVATVKVYETYTGQNGWTEVTQEEYDRTKDKYEHRIRRVPAPPAQTTLTDDARDAARYRWIRDVLRLDDVRWMNIANWNQANISAEVWDSEIDAALTAAQSASGDTNG